MLYRKVIVASVLSGFFPYLPGGMRVEHLFFPSLLAIFAVNVVLSAKAVSKPIIIMSMLLFAGAGFAVAFSVFLPNTGAVATMVAMSGRLLLPAIIFGAIAVAVPLKRDVVVCAAEAIVLVAVPITLLASATVLFDMSFIVDYFVNNGDDSVWSQAFSLGRFTGLFSQPLEAGIFYSVALLALVYLQSIKWQGTLVRYSILIIILIGGGLSLSKNFVVLGVLSALSYAVSIRVISFWRGIVLLCLTAGALVAWLLFRDDVYSNAFIGLFFEGGLLLGLTAGRLGAGDTEVVQLWNHLLASGDWLTGVGLGSYLPLDNGYLEYFYQGGVLALACYVFFILYVIIFSIRRYSINESKLLFFLGVFVAASSLGGPVTSANRANVPLLVLIASCVFCVSSCNRAKEARIYSLESASRY